MSRCSAAAASSHPSRGRTPVRSTQRRRPQPGQNAEWIACAPTTGVMAERSYTKSMIVASMAMTMIITQRTLCPHEIRRRQGRKRHHREDCGHLCARVIRVRSSRSRGRPPMQALVRRSILGAAPASEGGVPVSAQGHAVAPVRHISLHTVGGYGKSVSGSRRPRSHSESKKEGHR